MTAEVIYPHIVKTAGEPARLENHPRTRVAQIVMDYTEYGWSAEKIQEEHSYLTLAEVYSALAYYFDHTAEINQEIEDECVEYERLARENESSPLAKRLRELEQQHARSPLF